MGEPTQEIQLLAKPPEKRLDSWKEIAAYLNRDVPPSSAGRNARACQSIGMCTRSAAPSMHSLKNSMAGCTADGPRWTKPRLIRAGDARS